MIGIRVDANDIIATGHLMRCMAIAEQLRDMGQQVVFFVSDLLAKELVEKRDFKCICLHSEYNKKDAELDNLLMVLKKEHIDKLLIDSYEVTSTYMSKLNECIKLVYMDDLQQERYSVDLIVNYTIGLKKECYTSLGYLEKQLLLGNKYVPLRKEFSQSGIIVKQNIENVLITTGGTDTYNIVLKLLNKLETDEFSMINKKVVVGAFYDKIEQLEEYAKKNDSTEVFHNISNMQEIMCQCDVAISAGGTTLMELCACGIPTICFSIAENQLSGVKAFSHNGLMINAGDVRLSIEDVTDNIVANLHKISQDCLERKRISGAMKKMIDGKGARRIAEQLVVL